MSKEQIEEMAKDLQETHDYFGCEAWHCGGCQYEKYGENHMCSNIKQAEELTAKGYRKQVEGEWLSQRDGTHFCSNCGYDALYTYDGTEICGIACPFCGAKMKGGAE